MSMLIRSVQDVPAAPVTMPGASGAAMRLLVGRADGAPTFAMRLFEIAPGGHTPRHAHNYEHEIYVVAGKGQVLGGRAGSTIRPITAGDIIFMPPNEEHQLRNTGDAPLQFICLVPVAFDCGTGACQPTPGS
jgi:quercetin dioxygenase-like cupin family protein